MFAYANSLVQPRYNAQLTGLESERTLGGTDLCWLLCYNAELTSLESESRYRFTLASNSQPLQR